MNRIFSSGYFLAIPLAVPVLLWCLVRNDPFFGDAISSTSRAAIHIYDHQLGTVFYPEGHDPGHPTLYAWLLAVWWKLTVFSLPASHAFSVVWMLALMLVYRKIAMLFLTDEWVNRSLLLFALMPTVLSQGAMMLNTMAVMTFFLVAIYGLLKSDARWLIVGATLMMITHLESAFFLLSLAAADAFVIRGTEPLFRWMRRRWYVYAVPFAAFVLWLGIHKAHTGWFVRSPSYSDADELNGGAAFFKSLVLIVWRLVDFGMLPFYLVAVFGMIRRLGSGRLFKTWAVLTAATAFPLAFFLENTIGHRYFLAFSLLLIVAVCCTLQHLNGRAPQVLFLVLLVSLGAGSFLYYPGKNMGDGNLAYRGYFNLYGRISTDFQNIPFYSHAPVANPPRLTHLQENGLRVERINEAPLDSLPAVLQSNVSAEFSLDDKAWLADNFYGRSYEDGAVYVNVFLNPRIYEKPEGWKLREPSAAERCLGSVKRWWKGQ